MRTHNGTHLSIAFATVSLIVIACGGSDTSDFVSGSTGTAGSGSTSGTAGTQGSAGSSNVSGSGGTSAGGDNGAGGSMATGGTNGTSGAGGMSVAGGSSGAGGGAGSAVTDAGARSDAAPACAGMPCATFAGALAAAPRGATNISNCVIQMHQLDCCGARAAYGINHGARTTLCPAETTCVATYATPSPCADTTIKTDTGDTTMNEAEVKLRCVPMPGGATCNCETFVCKTDNCRAAPGIAGGCGQ